MRQYRHPLWRLACLRWAGGQPSRQTMCCDVSACGCGCGPSRLADLFALATPSRPRGREASQIKVVGLRGKLESQNGDGVVVAVEACQCQSTVTAEFNF